jgi:hypothetical protein
MQAAWLKYRQWRFVVDMNGDGRWTLGDVSWWAHWLLCMPGDALIALIGPTALGHFLALTPADIGSELSGWISAPLWIFGICYARDFVLDCADPTYRQQQHERREAEKQRRQIARGRGLPRKSPRLFWRIRLR